MLAECGSEVGELTVAARALMAEVLPYAAEEIDVSARLIAYTHQPGTYRGLIAAIALYKDHVNLMFAKGVELLADDTTHLLEGSGKQARHIKISEVEQLADPHIRQLITRASALTPHE